MVCAERTLNSRSPEVVRLKNFMSVRKVRAEIFFFFFFFWGGGVVGIKLLGCVKDTSTGSSNPNACKASADAPEAPHPKLPKP